MGSWGHQKSGTTICFDIVRHLLILSGTCYVFFSIWKHSSILALIAAIPVYVVALNVFGFLTLPLYLFTPENRLMAKADKAFRCGDPMNKRSFS